MAQIDANILLQGQQYKPADPFEMQQKAMALQAAGLQLAQARREDEYNRTLGDLYKANTDSGTGAVNTQGVIQGLAQAGLGARIPAYQKQLLEADKARADFGKTTAETGKLGMETDAGKFKMALDRQHATNDMLASVLSNPNATHQDVINGISGIVNRGLATPEEGMAIVRSLPGRPEDLRPFLMQKAIEGMDASKRMEMLAPKFQTMDMGGGVQTGTVNQLTGQFTPGQMVKKTVSPDAALQAQTSRSNNAATIAKDYAVAGLNANGTPTGDVEQMAQMIAKGQVPPLQGFALANPRGQRIMSRVAEINPEYDFTTVAAKKKAATDFTSGQQGNAIRSVATANTHLDQLGQLADALSNGDIPLVNKVRNTFEQQTGQTAPTNFDAIKNVVGQEVVKAIVAGGGSAGERDEAAKAFSNAASPAQLQQAIKQYRMVMDAQYQNLLAQRRAAGLPDSTLPNYNTSAHGSAAPASAVPADIAALLKKHGGQ